MSGGVVLDEGLQNLRGFHLSFNGLFNFDKDMINSAFKCYGFDFEFKFES